MATPASGQISMNDMRTHINRATSSSISMSEMRARYGGSGQISFSDLRKCEGFTVNPANIKISNKFFYADIDGWDGRGIFGTYGSVSPNEGNGVQVAANSYIWQMSSANGSSNASLTIGFDGTSNTINNGDAVTPGYRTTNLTRIVTANVARSISTTQSNSSVSHAYYNYDWPSSGTIHCLVKF